MKKKAIHIIIKSEDLSLRNEMHFEVQKNTRMNVFRARKGKGSFCRKPKYKKNWEE